MKCGLKLVTHQSESQPRIKWKPALEAALAQKILCVVVAFHRDLRKDQAAGQTILNN